MKHLFKYIYGLILIISFASCNDEEYVYPSVKLEFITAYADEHGAMKTVVSDDGVEWNVINDKSSTKFEGNSRNRIIANMEQLENNQTIIHSLTSIICAIPLPANSEEFENGIFNKPVEVVSIWQGLSYINMVLSIKTFNSKHAFHFIEEKLEIDSNGNANVQILLYHNSDIEIGYNTKRAYASIPISQYLSNECNQVNVYFDYYTEDGERQEYGPFLFKQ